MWNIPTVKQLSKIPRLYETEKTSLSNKKIFIHFFLGNCDWYIAEYDGKDLFYGFTILNGWYDTAEWGYISFQELKDLRVKPGFEVDREIDWKPVKASEIEKFQKCRNAF